MTGIYCGIDLGGTSAKLALADATGNIIMRDSFSTAGNGSPDVVVPKLAATINRMVQQARTETNTAILAGIGMGAPGLVDRHSGCVKFNPNMATQWRDVPIAQPLGKQFGCPVRLMNDVRTATLGELRFGRGKDRSDATFAFFSIGTGIGGGVVVDGKMRLGPLGAAGELGHQTVVPNGPRCGCGNRGCLETVASGTAIAAEGVRLLRSGLAPTLNELTEGDSNRVTSAMMAQAAESDPLVADAIEQAAQYLGIAAANVVVVLHPDLIVLGGGVASMGTRLTTTVKRVITERVGMFPTNDVQVECSQLGTEAGMRGAVALAMEE